MEAGEWEKVFIRQTLKTFTIDEEKFGQINLSGESLEGY